MKPNADQITKDKPLLASLFSPPPGKPALLSVRVSVTVASFDYQGRLNSPRVCSTAELTRPLCYSRTPRTANQITPKPNRIMKQQFSLHWAGAQRFYRLRNP